MVGVVCFLRPSHPTLEGRVVFQQTSRTHGQSKPAPRPSVGPGERLRAREFGHSLDLYLCLELVLLSECHRQSKRIQARRRRCLLRHGRPVFPKKNPNSSIATSCHVDLSDAFWRKAGSAKIEFFLGFSIVFVTYCFRHYFALSLLLIVPFSRKLVFWPIMSF